ncbi:DUF3592 domain-containing protein [Acidovorax sp. Root70]|uniref:DUF3592 domain-containing protein n=1 Tax=Acidovorax sp. Root70 TaxID=1736590 RepID=UPI0006FD1712|nr:DUF3592 domain-containing protein [Acidovorax sp. Root70]KRB28678.1 hypothetical protein ASD94_06910 [Acidovorax sp. Root70]
MKRPSSPSTTRGARNPAARTGKRAGGWLLGLFALPFAAVGVGMLLLSVLPTLYDWARVQWWQPVPATLVTARLETSRSSKSSSYTVKASYRYQVAGREYQGDRVAISGGGDNVGDFQEALGARLEQALRDGAPVQVWVSPTDPAQAVIDRSLRPGLLALKMVFVVVFGGVGVGLLVHVLRPARAAQGLVGSNGQPLTAGMPGRVERIPGGVTMYFPAGRWWGLKLALALFGAVFLAVGALVPWEQEASADVAPWLLRLVFGGVGGMVLLGSFYALANSLRVRLDHNGLRTERRLLGLMLQWHQVPGPEIARLRVVESYAVQSNSRREVYFRIVAELRGGRQLTIAQDLKGRAQADKLLASIGGWTGYATR